MLIRIPILQYMYETVLEALFPTPRAEEEVLLMDADVAWKALPRASEFPIREACSIFAYKDERVWRLIWALKYKKSSRAAAIGGQALWRILRIYSEAAGVPIIIVPMPITKKRRRERGFNQCELLLKEIEMCARAAVPKIDGGAEKFIFARDLLIRARHKSRQTLKDRSERLESAHDIFTVNEGAADLLKSRIQSTEKYLLIVIDDVVTTGSTIKDAIYTLRRAGFENAFGLSVAH